jgi:hypothetical protein
MYFYESMFDEIKDEIDLYEKEPLETSVRAACL